MLLLFFIYFSIVAFVGISLYKAYQYGKMPMHARWELYPVPKEAGERGHYGGSYYEDLDWWKKPRKVSHLNEIKEMLKEMLFIKNLFVNQKGQWWLSYALHLGIYLLGLWTMLLFTGALFEIAGLPVTANNSTTAIIYYGTVLSGVFGAVLLTAGSLGLVLKRIFNNTFRKYTTPQEYFNLLFILAVAVSGLVVYAGDPAFNYGREIMKGLLTFSPIQAGTDLIVHVILLGALLIYIPQTKMSHYVGKYFAFHKVLWENEPNIRNSKVEEKVKENLSYKPKTSWSAPHISSGTLASEEK